MSNSKKSAEEKNKDKSISGDKRRKKSLKQRSQFLLLAADSAIDRLKNLSEPGGEVESMDIKDLKSFISSIKELSTLSTELSATKESGGVVILPEVEIDE